MKVTYVCPADAIYSDGKPCSMAGKEIVASCKRTMYWDRETQQWKPYDPDEEEFPFCPECYNEAEVRYLPEEKNDAVSES